MCQHQSLMTQRSLGFNELKDGSHHDSPPKKLKYLFLHHLKRTKKRKQNKQSQPWGLNRIRQQQTSMAILGATGVSLLRGTEAKASLLASAQSHGVGFIAMSTTNGFPVKMWPFSVGVSM